MKIGDELKRLREERGWSQAEVARRAKIAQSYYAQFELNARPVARIEKRWALCDAFGLPRDHFEKLGSPHEEDFGGELVPAAPGGGKHVVPIVGELGAGRPRLVEFAADYDLPDEFREQGADAVFTVRGMSMAMAGIIDKDRLAVKQSDKAKHGEIVVAYVDSHEGCCVRFYHRPKRSDTPQLRKPNTERDAIELSEDDKIRAVYVGLIRVGYKPARPQV